MKLHTNWKAQAACFVLLCASVSILCPELQATGATNNKTVLILGSTVTGGSESLEAQQARALGFTVEVADGTTWGGKSAAEFATYRAIILGDPTCVYTTAPISAAETNRTVWGQAVKGNIAIVGTDPVYHSVYFPGAQGQATALIKNAIAFATKAGSTGAYISLSCYYENAAPGTPVPVLDQFGTFNISGLHPCRNNSQIVAPTHAMITTPNLLTNPGLSNWSCSTHEVFVSWPKDFDVLVTSAAAPSITSISAVGDPYILASHGNSISKPLVGGGVTNVWTFPVTDSTGPHTVVFKARYPAGHPDPGVTMTVTLNRLSQFRYKELIAGSDFAARNPNSTCILILGLDNNCGILSVACDIGGQKVTCPPSSTTTPVHVEESYDSNVVQLNPAFLKFEGTSVSDQLTNFLFSRNDPTDEATPIAWSDWVAADKGAAAFTALTAPSVYYSPTQRAFLTAGTFTTATPLTLPQNVFVQLGGFYAFVPKTSFRPLWTGGFLFVGPIQGVNVEVEIEPEGIEERSGLPLFGFTIAGLPVNLNVTSPSAVLPLTLTVGDFYGTRPQVPVIFVPIIDF